MVRTCLNSVSSCSNNALDEDIIIEPAGSTPESKVWVEDDHIPGLGLPALSYHSIPTAATLEAYSPSHLIPYNFEEVSLEDRMSLAENLVTRNAFGNIETHICKKVEGKSNLLT